MVFSEASGSWSDGGWAPLLTGGTGVDRCSPYQKCSPKQGGSRDKCPISPSALLLSFWGLPWAELQSVGKGAQVMQ